MAEGRLNPSFSVPDEEAGVPQELPPVVMGPPGYASPDPATSAGVLVDIHEHPNADLISDDYAAGERAAGYDSVGTTLGGENASPLAGLPENRDEWTADNWKAAAEHYGLATSGKKDVLRNRVEEHEAALDEAAGLNAGDWVALVNATDNEGDLEELKDRYTQSGASFSTVDSAFEAKQAEFDGS